MPSALSRCSRFFLNFLIGFHIEVYNCLIEVRVYESRCKTIEAEVVQNFPGIKVFISGFS